MLSRLTSKASIALIVALSIVASLGIVACSEDNAPTSPIEDDSAIGIGKRVAPAPGSQPDLVITSVTSNSPLVTAWNGGIVAVPQRIIPGQSRTVSYTLYLGPCDFNCLPPLGPVPSQINSVVDPLGEVTELVEGNNNGPTLLVCNQCG